MQLSKNGVPVGDAYGLDLREGDGITLTVSDERQTTGAMAVTVGNGGSQPVLVTSYAGADPTGATDSSAAVQAAINAAYAAGGGYVTGRGVFRCDSQITIPFSSVDNQRTVALVSPDGDGTTDFYAPHSIGNPTAGFVLDLRYSGTGAKLVALGGGILVLDGVRIGCLDSTVDSTPLLLVTIPQPRIRNCTFFGNTTHTGTGCLQDAIVLGGTGTTKLENDITAAFSGYGGFVKDNSFTNIRKAVLAQNRVNGVVVRGNLIDNSCGSSETNSAPIVLDPGANDGNHYALGNVIADNTIEYTNYNYGIKLNNGSSQNSIHSNGYWDSGAGTVGPLWLDNTTCTGNTIRIDGYTNLRTITGASGSAAGLGLNHVEETTGQFASWTSEFKPATWKLFLAGLTDGKNSLTWDSTLNALVLSGSHGVAHKYGSTGAQYVETVFAGNPNGNVTGNPGDRCADTTNGRLYVKRSGTNSTSGWVLASNLPAQRQEQYLSGLGLIAENFELGLHPTQSAPASGELSGSLMGLLAGDVITNVIVAPLAAGSSMTLAKAAIYSASGTQLASSADQSALFTAGGLVPMPLSSPYTITADGVYLVSVLFVGTMPNFACGQGSSVHIWAALSGGKARWLSQTGLSDLPSPSTFTNPGSTSRHVWVGVN